MKTVSVQKKISDFWQCHSGTVSPGVVVLGPTLG